MELSKELELKSRETFHSLVFAKTFEDRKCILLANPDLSSNEIDQVIEGLISDAKDSDFEQIIDDYEVHRELLKEYKDKGLEALINFHSITEITTAFVKFTDEMDSNDKRQAFLEENMYLISNFALGVIDRFIEQHKKKMPKLVPHFRIYRDLLRTCRVLPIDEVFKEYSMPSDEVYNAVLELAKKDDIYDSLHTRTIYRDLLSQPEVINVFRLLQAVYVDNKAKLRQFAAVWDFISQLQPPELRSRIKWDVI